MMATLVKALADLRRRRLQGAVIFVIVLLAAGTGTMAITLLSQTRDPYQAAFSAQQGAHLQVFYNRNVGLDQLASTPGLIGATASGGPYPGTAIQVQHGARKLPLAVIGRDNPGGSVEKIDVAAGHWPRSDSEIAVTRSWADLNRVSVGDRLKVVSVPQVPVFTVAAEVVDIDEGSADLSSQSSWVLAGAVAQLEVPGQNFYKMDYRFASDPTSAQLQRSVDRLRSTLPPGSISGALNYLLIRDTFNITNSILTNVLLAFSVFALIATAAIVANLVTGIVIAAYREIGIMKAVGFTPAQVVEVLVLQVLLPALAGGIVGVPLGTLLSQPLLANSSHALGLAYSPTFSLSRDLLALTGLLLLVALAATLPALRAGLLKPSAVIVGASAPSGAGGRFLRRQASRLRLPQALTLGVGDAFARPLRGTLTLLAVLLGVATATVAVGLPRSFTIINNGETGAGKYQVVVQRSPAYPDSRLTAVLDAQPQTRRVVAVAGDNISVPGIGNPVNTFLFRGDVSRLGFQLVKGRWFSGPGEVVAPMALLRDAHLQIGQSFTGSVRGRTLQLRVVGEVFDVSSLGHQLFTDLATLAAVPEPPTPTQYDVTLAPGTNVGAYVNRVTAVQPEFIDARP
ncbi:MAG: ABC transporter permease, partial [Candidatus Dormibacteraeota bacterium]|nr:ABC transporter permease [Candidatus Dormibacteraeota bacterium]